METLLFILGIGLVYLAYKKGKEIFDRKISVYKGGEKTNQWGYLRDVYEYLPEEPHEINFFNDKLDIRYHFGRFHVSVLIFNRISHKEDYKIFTQITDSELERLKQSKYPEIECHAVAGGKIEKLKDSRNKNLINNAINNYKELIKEALSESYKKAGISI